MLWCSPSKFSASHCNPSLLQVCGCVRACISNQACVSNQLLINCQHFYISKCLCIKVSVSINSLLYSIVRQLLVNCILLSILLFRYSCNSSVYINNCNWTIGIAILFSKKSKFQCSAYLYYIKILRILYMCILLCSVSLDHAL